MIGTNNNSLIDKLIDHHKRQTELCDLLEAIADQLPKAYSKQHCLAAARCVFPIVKEAHRFEEETIFPLLQKSCTEMAGLAKSLERLQYEHWEDESFAEELCESLLEFGAGRAPESADKLSYMLRGFFEGLRRHLAFESEHILPILKMNLTGMKLKMVN